ncbi:MAG: hypothetical protein FWD65_03565 [Coriobacteriia bacterium]|nr:hypothetical protein [Coriobacteriia bacterium]
MNGAFHYKRTKKWAIDEAGFSEAAAELVARSDDLVDTEHHWTLASDLQRGDARWHLDGEFGRDLLDGALASGDLLQLGRALHVLQDFCSHNNLDLKPGKVTPLYWGFPLRRWHGHYRAVHGMYPSRGQILSWIRPGRLQDWLLVRAHNDIWETQRPQNQTRLHDWTVTALKDFATAWPKVADSSLVIPTQPSNPAPTQPSNPAPTRSSCA